MCFIEIAPLDGNQVLRPSIEELGILLLPIQGFFLCLVCLVICQIADLGEKNPTNTE